MQGQLGFPNDLLNPLMAAVFAELVGLWLDYYLSDWRWRPLLLLGLALLFSLGAALANGALGGWPELALRLWYGFLGGSVAVFGREVVLNVLALLGSGPRKPERVQMAKHLDRWV